MKKVKIIESNFQIAVGKETKTTGDIVELENDLTAKLVEKGLVTIIKQKQVTKKEDK